MGSAVEVGQVLGRFRGQTVDILLRLRVENLLSLDIKLVERVVFAEGEPIILAFHFDGSGGGNLVLVPQVIEKVQQRNQDRQACTTTSTHAQQWVCNTAPTEAKSK